MLRTGNALPDPALEYGAAGDPQRARGASVLVGNEIEKLQTAYRQTLKEPRTPMRPKLWDGHTAPRCLAAILDWEGMS